MKRIIKLYEDKIELLEQRSALKERLGIAAMCQHKSRIVELLTKLDECENLILAIDKNIEVEKAIINILNNQL